MKKSKNVINFQSAKSIKELVTTANDHIFGLEDALYKIMDAKSLEAAREIAADALGEDLDIYLEEDNLEQNELDFENQVYTDDENFNPEQ